MTTSTATGPRVPAPTSRQREWMLTALRHPDRELPAGVSSRSLVLMRDRKWIEPLPVKPGTSGPSDRLTSRGSLALLSIPKANALMSVLTSPEEGRIDANTSARTMSSLVREGLVTMLTKSGAQATGQEQHPHITNLGRRLVGLPEVDQNPAPQP